MFTAQHQNYIGQVLALPLVKKIEAYFENYSDFYCRYDLDSKKYYQYLKLLLTPL